MPPGKRPASDERGYVPHLGGEAKKSFAWGAGNARQLQQAPGGREKQLILRDVDREIVEGDLERHGEPESATQLVRLPQPPAQDRKTLLRSAIALQEPLPCSALRLHEERLREGGHQISLRTELHLGVTPALGVRGVAKQEDQPFDGDLGAIHSSTPATFATPWRVDARTIQWPVALGDVDVFSVVMLLEQRHDRGAPHSLQSPVFLIKLRTHEVGGSDLEVLVLDALIECRVQARRPFRQPVVLEPALEQPAHGLLAGM
jgi:hypothetical protein